MSERVLVVGGTGRTGMRLVDALRDEPGYSVAVLARDREKFDLLFRCDDEVEIIEGDLTNTEEWEAKLEGFSQIVSTVSCGMRTDPFVILGLRQPPGPLPYDVDYQGISKLVSAAEAHGVQRLIAVSSACAETPFSVPALVLNTLFYFSVKWKFEGEQAIRRSKLDYIIIRPFELVDTPKGEPTNLGIETSQGKEGSSRRSIPREDVASVCVQALRRPLGQRLTFECWATNEHRRGVPWESLRPDSIEKGGIVSHNLATGVVIGGTAIFGGGVATVIAKGVLRVARMWK